MAYKGVSVTVSLTSRLTGLDQSVVQIKTKIVSTHTADSKPVKQELSVTMILPSLVFPALTWKRFARNKHVCHWQTFTAWKHSSLLYQIIDDKKVYKIDTRWSSQLDRMLPSLLTSYLASWATVGKEIKVHFSVCNISGQCYKTFYGRKLRLFIISKSVCP